MLTVTVVILLAVGVYAQRAGGALLVDTMKLSPTWQRVLNALPVAIISAVIALAAASSDGELDFVDARLAGVLAAAVCAWRRLPIFVTVVVAALTTAILRLIWG